MKEESTLADTVFRSCFEKRSAGLFAPGFANLLAKAHKFVLDEGMSAFLADLGWAAYNANPSRVLDIVDSTRKLARLPHAVTWFEWDERALAKRASSQYRSRMDVDKVPIKSGVLCVQHPQVDTAFMAMSFGIQRDDNIYGKGLGMCPFGFQWRADDGPMMFKPDAEIESVLSRTRIADSENSKIIGQGINAAGMLTGCIDYRGPVGFAEPDGYLNSAPKTRAALSALVGEQGGMMRYVLAFLATINDLPVASKQITASKGFISRGRYRKYLNHTTLTLTVPADRHIALARKTVTSIRRRAHEVRGHWRHDWRHPLTPACEHEFTATEDTLSCNHCKGQKLWIAEHQRGNDRVGFTMHNYKVTHPKEPVPLPKYQIPNIKYLINY